MLSGTIRHIIVQFVQNRRNQIKVGAFGTQLPIRYFLSWLYQSPKNPIRIIPVSMTQTLSLRNHQVVFTQRTISSSLPMSK